MLIGVTISPENSRRSVLTNYELLGICFSTSIPKGYALLTDVIEPALYGISFILSDRMPIKEQIGIQGLSFILSDRMPIKEQVSLQGVSFELEDTQGFNFQFGFSGVSFESADEQTFELQNGMKAIDVELDNPTGRGYIIKK
jgi:hypothetical protein